MKQVSCWLAVRKSARWARAFQRGRGTSSMAARSVEQRSAIETGFPQRAANCRNPLPLLNTKPSVALRLGKPVSHVGGRRASGLDREHTDGAHTIPGSASAPVAGAAGRHLFGGRDIYDDPNRQLPLDIL